MFLDFEQSIATIHKALENVKLLNDVEQIKSLEEQLLTEKKTFYSQLTRWQKVQLARHPQRPYTLYYIEQMCDSFTELHGDRRFGDDKAMIGGFGKLGGETFMFIGQQKGSDTKSRQYRNFGMAMPEGYRKALRLMKLAEKFNRPVVCLIDTPGAFPGIEAEERGQAAAIAENLMAMIELKVPIICVIIGEGASGGALGIGVGDVTLMMEYTWYSVISPESCSSILWNSWKYKERAAEMLQLAADDMLRFDLVDAIIPEPLGGAHHQPAAAAVQLKKYILEYYRPLSLLEAGELVNNRIDKWCAIGPYQEDQK